MAGMSLDHVPTTLRSKRKAFLLAEYRMSDLIIRARRAGVPSDYRHEDGRYQLSSRYICDNPEQPSFSFHNEAIHFWVELKAFM